MCNVILHTPVWIKGALNYNNNNNNNNNGVI